MLKDIAYEYSPKELLDRPKVGFGVPLDKWLRGPLKEGTGELVEEICKRIGSCLREQGLSDSPSDFLEAQGRSVTERIRDGRIRNMHLMEGV